MNIKFLPAIVLFYLFNSVSPAQWIPLVPNSTPDSEAKVQVISQDNSGIVIKVELQGFQLKEFLSDGKKYNSIEINADGITSETGMPQLPHIAKLLAIPDQGTVSVEVLETAPVQVFNGINIAPARESWIEGKPETPYLENQEIYASTSVYPSAFVSIESPVIFRDFRLARLSIFPIRYSPGKREVQAISSITVRINFGPGIGINPKLTSHMPIAPSFDKVYRSLIFNYDEVLQQRYNGMVEGHDYMLCIMPDMYVEEFQLYADWKNQSGTEIKVTKFSEIGANYNDPLPIKNYIQNIYNSGVDVPTHILIVGDKGSVQGCAPVKYVNYDWTFVNEDYFVELDGTDYFPEMMIGRFTNHGSDGEYRLQVMVNKFLKYEKYPSTTSNEWYTKATVCSNNAYQSQVDTKRFAAQTMLAGGFTSVDTMMSNPQCTYNVNSIISAINNGRSFLNYRGEGWSDGWHANCYYFNSSNVNGLNNSNKLTFVTSIGCGVAMFDASQNCFGETWIEMGSLTEAPRGGSAFIGPTSNTHTAYNNSIDKGIYVGMFENKMDSPGEALLRGKLYMYLQYGNTYWVEYHYRIYCILGDPSIHVWKDIPKPVAVNYPTEVFVGLNQVQITVTDSVSGTPVENARVCIYGNGVYEFGTTDISGNLVLTITPSSQGTLNLTVTGGNVVPKEKIIQVSLGTENITLHGAPLVTDLDGNNDGKINPNENCSITFTLKNWGTIISNNVYAILSVPDSITNVVVTLDSVNFGNINPADSVTGAPFQFFISPECPVGYNIPFKLYVASTTSSWNYSDVELVHGCLLNFDQFFVDDEGNLLHNFRMDPGETVKLKFKILNTGDDIAPDVLGIIRTSDQYMTILDSVAEFGSILPDSNSTNESDTYTVKISENCPPQYNAIFSLELSTQNGLYPYELNEVLILPVAMPSAADPTGPDAYGYYAYSSVDTLWDQAPQYNWIEIQSIGTEIVKPGGMSDFTQTVNLPFNFKYYGNNFSQLRISGDGWIAFGSGTQTRSVNRALPCLDTLNNMTAVFWDDFFSPGPQGGGKLFYYFDAANHRFIVEWDTVPHVSDLTDKETFEIILLDPAHYPTPTGDGEIIMQYKLVEEPGSCTIGTENSTEDIGLQYVFNELYDATANQLVDGLAIKFTTKIPNVVSVNDDENTNGMNPTAYKLEQNYPNPFNPETKIIYSIPEAGFVKLYVYDINGTLIKTLIEREQTSGRYEIIWDGKNQQGEKVCSGVYFYRMQANSFIQTRKMILLK